MLPGFAVQLVANLQPPVIRFDSGSILILDAILKLANGLHITFRAAG